MLTPRSCPAGARHHQLASHSPAQMTTCTLQRLLWPRRTHSFHVSQQRSLLRIRPSQTHAAHLPSSLFTQQLTISHKSKQLSSLQKPPYLLQAAHLRTLPSRTCLMHSHISRRHCKIYGLQRGIAVQHLLTVAAPRLYLPLQAAQPQTQPTLCPLWCMMRCLLFQWL